MMECDQVLGMLLLRRSALEKDKIVLSTNKEENRLLEKVNSAMTYCIIYWVSNNKLPTSITTVMSVA